MADFSQLASALSSGRAPRLTLGGKPLSLGGLGNIGGGGGSGSSIYDQFKLSASPQLNEVIQAPDTWNLGSALLNLLSVGSAPIAGVGREVTEGLERLSRVQSGQETLDDRDALARWRANPLSLATDAAGSVFEGAAGGVGDTLAAVTGQGPDENIPMWSENYRRIQNAGVQGGWWEEPSNEPGLFGIGQNDGALAVGGILTDIATDPTTYLTLGLGGLVKGGFMGAAKAGTTAGKAAVRASQAAELGLPTGTVLDRAVTTGDRLAGALEGAREGFTREVGRFWPADAVAASRARRAAKAEGTTDLEEGLLPTNAGGAAARAVADEVESARLVDDVLTPEARAAAEGGEALTETAATTAELGKAAAATARVGSDEIDDLADDVLAGVSRETRQVRDRATEAWSSTLAKSVDQFAPGTQKAIRAVSPFAPKPTVKPLTAVGEKGERDALGALVSFWKQSRSGAALSKPRQALKPQLDALAKTKIPLTELAERYPELHRVLQESDVLWSRGRRVGSSKPRTTIEADAILDILSSDRLMKAVRALERGGRVPAPGALANLGTVEARLAQLLARSDEGSLEILRGADAQARELLGGLVDRVSGKAMRGASELSSVQQAAMWQERLAALLTRTARGVENDPAWASQVARDLSKVTDPAELAEKLDGIASTVHLAAHKGPKDFFSYLEKMPAREVLDRVSGQGIRDFAKLIGLPVKGNTLTVLKALRENGYVAYREAIETERTAAKAFGEANVAGHDVISEGVRAIGNDVTAIKQTLAERAAAAFEGLDDVGQEAVFAALNRGLRGNLAGRSKKAKPTKAGELEIVAQVTRDGQLSVRHTIQRVEDFTQYEMFRELLTRYSKAADELGLAGPQRAAYLDEQTMRALGAIDDYLLARGMAPTSRMTDAEKTFRLGGKSGLSHKNEVAFLSLRDVLEEIPEAQRRALLFSGRHASIPPTILHMLGRWAIRRFEAPTEEIAERIAEYRNAYIQQAWKAIDSKGSGLFTANRGKANSYGALADQILTDEAVVARLTEKHVARAVAARGVWADAAASASMDIRNAFRRSMTSAATPEGLKIGDLMKLTERIGKALDQAGIEDDLVRTMAQLDASVLVGETVGPDLFYAARRSGQARAAEKVSESGSPITDAEFMAIRDGFGNDEAITAAAKRAGEAGGTTRLKETLRTRAGREGEATSGERLLRDAEPDITEATDEMVRALTEAGQSVAPSDIASIRASLQMQLGFSNRFAQGMLTKFKRGYGMDRANILRTMAQFAPVQMTERFNRGLADLAAKYGSGSAPALVAGFRLLQRLDADPQGARVMAAYVDALKAQITTGAAQDGTVAAREALLGTLSRVGGSEAGDEVLEAAVDLWPAVSRVFDSSPDGLFARAGNDGNDVNAILDAFQTKDPDGKPLELYGGFHFTQNGTAGDLGPAWRTIGAGGQQIDPIEILRSTHGAMQHATVAPTIAASFSREFGHEASGLTRAEAIARGWKLPYDPTDARRPFVKYLDPTQLYDPEMISELKYLDDMMQGIQKPGPFMQKVFDRIDPIVSAMKSSITIWRPGHWMTNIMGEAWMNVFAGVTNPARYAESIGLMTRNHGMVKPEMSFFDDYFARNAPEGMQPRAIDTDTPITELPLNGKMQRVPDDLLYRGLEQRGIVLSHVQADDVAFDAAQGAMQIGKKKPLQGIRNANAWLGRASVARDSIFRVAHALDVIKKGNYRSLDQALDAAAAAVHKWHPSYQTLTPFDQVYTRRVLYFYTWMRQAIARMLELSLNSPSMAVLPSRVQYAIAYANGLDPESVGSPVAGDLPLPDYLANSLTGSAFELNGRVYGMSLNAPTLDIFNQILAPITYDPTLSAPDNFANALGNWTERNVGQMISPAISIPYTLATNQTTRGADFDPNGGAAGRIQNVVDATGLGYLSRISGQVLPGIERTDLRTEPVDQQERQLLALVNAITGMKFTSQSAGNVQNSAERDDRDRLARLLEQQAAQQAANG